MHEKFVDAVVLDNMRIDDSSGPGRRDFLVKGPVPAHDHYRAAGARSQAAGFDNGHVAGEAAPVQGCFKRLFDFRLTGCDASATCTEKQTIACKAARSACVGPYLVADTAKVPGRLNELMPGCFDGYFSA
jgi:hypothetical protein